MSKAAIVYFSQGGTPAWWQSCLEKEEDRENHEDDAERVGAL